MNRTLKRGLLIALAVVLVLAAVGVYLNDYYRADPAAIADANADVRFTAEVCGDGIRGYIPEDGEYDTALIFYPGGKVECTAYEPLLARCAENGVLGLLIQMPGNLAVLDTNAAERAMALYPQVQHWYMAGHSLGGSMAASFAAKHGTVEGLILLAAYSTEDVSGIPVLSIYGSADGVMNREKYEHYRKNLPDDLTEVVIEGGNHAGFGLYGSQDGDGEAAISSLEQIEQTAQLIVQFIK